MQQFLTKTIVLNALSIAPAAHERSQSATRSARNETMIKCCERLLQYLGLLLVAIMKNTLTQPQTFMKSRIRQPHYLKGNP